MNTFGTLLFGQTVFGESEEHLEFQFKFLCVLMVSGALATALFLFGAQSEINRLAGPHLYSMSAFTAAALALWLALRGHKARFLPLAWTYEAVCLLEYTSALVFVPQDELRLLWFFINIPGVYILLGKRAGLAVTLLSIAILVVGNPHLAAPYSPNAVATAVVAMAYLALFFHIYTDRSISYFVRMRESNERLYAQATRDALTGVLNARAYYALCDQLLEVAQRSGHPAAVLFIDLDHFKAINDTHGHAAGDRVLKTVADTLDAQIRRSDALGRIGGEEFSIFLPETDLDAALQVGEKIRRAVEACAPLLADGQRLRVTASVGVAASPRGGERMQDIQRRADQAMYRAKAAGRNRVSGLNASETA